MECVFRRFDSFDFEADCRFQEGLKTLKQETNTSRDDAKHLDMKLFFYNRFVERIDRSGYKQWNIERLDPKKRPGSDCDISEKTQTEEQRAAETDTQTDTELDSIQLSFAEVMRLVQEGKEVPGATTLEVKATNQSPTPSQMDRKLKPWEISSADQMGLKIVDVFPG